MKFPAFLHAGKHCLFHKGAAVLFFFLRIPALIHGKNLHFLLLHLFMVLILHVQPHTIHFLKQYGNLFFPLCLACIHLLYCVFFLFADSFTQPLYYIPDTTRTDTLSAGTVYYLCCNTVWRFGYCHGKLLCQIRGNQPDLIHLHCLIQQIHIGFLSVFQLCLIYPPAICNFTVNCFYRGGACSFIPIVLFIPSVCQFLIIGFQHDSCNLPA